MSESVLVQAVIEAAECRCEACMRGRRGGQPGWPHLADWRRIVVLALAAKAARG